MFNKIPSVQLIPLDPKENTNPKTSLSSWTIMSELIARDYMIHPLDQPTWHSGDRGQRWSDQAW